MQVQVLKSKIHRARVTQSDLEYEGSLGVDLDLMEEVGILPYEKLLVVNANNGARLETYAIPAPRESRTFCLNGAAARLGEIGDVITLMVFGVMPADEAVDFVPRIVVLDENNEIEARRGAFEQNA